MKWLIVPLLAAASFATAAESSYPALSYPDWAYAVPTPENEATAPHDDGTLFSLPASEGRFTRSQINGANHTAPADWYPHDHPPMPKLVASGDT
ncbi:MAG TPA: hypothetical protein VNN98_01600, partial [Rhizomicrobium sp.]|nr:hypothetical protein [Rhizomicrobium sp.]